MGIKLYVMGTPKLYRDDVLLPFSHAKALALLAYLSLQSTPSRRERLLTLLWSESDNKAARKNLSNTFWQIRRQLGDVIVTNGTEVAIQDDFWVDARLFKQTGALDLYTGVLLDGLHLKEAAPFELWVANMREQLSQLYRQGVEEAAVSIRQQKRWVELLTLAQKGIVDDSVDETLQHFIIEAYIHMGQRTLALQQYQRLQEQLQREWGIDPAPETKHLMGSLGHRPVSGVHSQSFTPIANVRGKGITKRPFVGRKEELDSLSEAWQRSQTSGFQVVAIIGELGIGKSSLWQQWSANLPTDVSLVTMRGVQEIRETPLTAVIAAFRRFRWEQTIYDEAGQFPHHLRTAITNLAPNMAMPAIEHRTPLAAEARQTVFDTVLDMMLYFIPPPLIIFFDDIHWADTTSIQWLRYVAEVLPAHPILLVCAARPEEMALPLNTLLVNWERMGIACRLELSQFNGDEAAELVQQLAGDMGRLEKWLQISRGSPYFLKELIQANEAGIPATLVQLLQTRMRHLSSAAQQVAEACTVLGDFADFDTLQYVTQQSENELLSGIEALIQYNVLEERFAYFDFVHPLVTDVLKQSLTGVRLRLLHQRAAQAIERYHVETLAVWAGQVAQHYEAAGDNHQAAKYADIATEHALIMTALPYALRFAKLAVILEPTAARTAVLQKVEKWYKRGVDSGYV
ncbi:MAG: AAA family ATPase [Ardenticatenaceae bacterium]|nr:AAA family ATPase [Ardenticatenaceae bacterium]